MPHLLCKVLQLLPLDLHALLHLLLTDLQPDHVYQILLQCWVALVCWALSCIADSCSRLRKSVPSPAIAKHSHSLLEVFRIIYERLTYRSHPVSRAPICAMSAVLKVQPTCGNDGSFWRRNAKCLGSLRAALVAWHQVQVSCPSSLSTAGVFC